VVSMQTQILKRTICFIIYGHLEAKILSDSWGQAQPNISQEYLKKFCFALPPHEEQKVIVTKVKQLMSWCDELEKKIEKRDAYQDKMMQAVVKQAFKTDKE
jgi:type I restriction enzyme S subunit